MLCGLKKAALKITAVSAVVFILLCSMLTVNAATGNGESYNTYTYRQYINSKTLVSSKPMYNYETTLYGSDFGLGKLEDITDVCTDKNGNAYILDGGKSRVIRLNSNHEIISVITTLNYMGESIDFTGAKGVFVDDNGLLYISDTQNQRVIIINNNEVSSILLLPESDLIPESFEYAPIKIAVDSKGYIYVLSNGSYYGALLYNPQKEFCGFYGSNTVKATVATVLENIKDMIFQSNEKISASERTLPFTFNDLAIYGDFVYTVTGVSAELGQINKFSPGGTNILKSKVGITTGESSSYEFQDNAVYDGILKKTEQKGTLQTDFVGIDIANEMIYAVDAAYGKIFIYDQDCNFLNVFGSGQEQGIQKGTFVKPVAVAVNDDRIYVADNSKSQITVFKVTEYGSLVMQAQKLTRNGNYSTAKPLWEKALRMDRGCILAYRGIAKALFLEEDYKECMKYSKMGYDQATYAQAFESVRNDFLADNFVWIVVPIVLIAGGLIYLKLYTSKHNIKLIKNKKLNVALSTIAHPFDSFNSVRYKNQGSVIIGIAILALYYVSLVLSNVYVGFSFEIFDINTFDSLYAFASSVGVIILWVVVNFAICSLQDGKGSFKQIFIVTCYALIPLVISNLLKLCLTNCLTPAETAFINAISVILILYAAFLLCIGIMAVHEYDFFKFLGTTVITLLGMGLVIFTIFLVFMLFQQAGNFISTVTNEILTR